MSDTRDIVERLRLRCALEFDEQYLCDAIECEAADEIKRLRSEIARLREERRLVVRPESPYHYDDHHDTGWLAEEEREAVEASREFWQVECDSTLGDDTDRRYLAALSGLLARSTPPEVEAACDMTPAPGDGELMRSYIEGWNNAGKLWRASITAEGIKVKEVSDGMSDLRQ